MKMKKRESGNAAVFLLIIILIVGASANNRKHETASQELRQARSVQMQQTEKKWAKFHDDMDYEFGRGKYAHQRRYAQEKGESGSPRWTEPFSKVDMFGKPTVFSPEFGKRR